MRISQPVGDRCQLSNTAGRKWVCWNLSPSLETRKDAEWSVREGILVCVLFWGWGYSSIIVTVLISLTPQPDFLLPNTRGKAFATVINILSVSPFDAGNNCKGEKRQRSARVTWTPLRHLLSSLGQLAERVLRFPQVGLITIANWDFSGSSGRNELMEVGNAFLTFLALLENSVQETCGHYFVSASLTPDFHGLIVKTPDWWNDVIIWVRQGHVTCSHKGNPNLCTNAWCGWPLNIGAAGDSSISPRRCWLGNHKQRWLWWYREERSSTLFTDEEIKP